MRSLLAMTLMTGFVAALALAACGSSGTGAGGSAGTGGASGTGGAKGTGGMKGSGGTAGSMQRDGYAVTGERGDDGCLIANAVEPILRCATDVTVRDMSDDDRFVEQRLRTIKPHCEVGTILLHLRKQAFPAKARTCKIPSLHHTTKIRDAAFHRLDTTVASGIER